jgi:pSer/pThr/pTyr-binding forkhead associated (FHA) protein
VDDGIAFRSTSFLVQGDKERDMAGRLFPAGGGRSIALTKRVMILGRSPDCDIRVDNPVVSGRHLRLIFDGNAWVVEDLQSRNGTAVNGRAVTKQALKSGDTLIVSAKIRFVIEYKAATERMRFAEGNEEPQQAGDDRSYTEHGPATTRLEPHDKDVWTEFE